LRATLDFSSRVRQFYRVLKSGIIGYYRVLNRIGMPLAMREPKLALGSDLVSSAIWRVAPVNGQCIRAEGSRTAVPSTRSGRCPFQI
jgi:hypothetical protein